MISVVFYVYVLFRPWDGSPCYVGKGHGKRWRQFPQSRNPHLRNIVANAGGELPHVKIRNGLTESEAFSIERAFINAIGRGCNGPLVNMTDGGEGVAGWVASEETRGRMSAAGKGRIFTEEHKANLRVKNSDETKRRKSVSATGRILPPEVREKLRIVARKRTFSKETRAKMSAIHKGKPKSEDHKRKLSDVQIGKIVSAETREKMSAAARLRRKPNGNVSWQPELGFG